MALFVLQSAAAGTGIVSARFHDHMRDLTVFHIVHNISSCPALAKLLGHKPHRPIDVSEENPVARTEIIKTGFTFRRLDEPVLGTLAVADEEELTPAAVCGQGIELISAELALLPGTSQLGHLLLGDIAQQVPGLHKVIAGVHIAIVLHCHGGSAGRREGADARGNARPGGQSNIKDLHKGLAHVPLHPFIEDGDQETAILLGLDRTVCDGVALLKAGIIISLNYGYELDEIGLDLISEKAVNLQRMIGIGGMNCGQDIVVYLVLSQEPGCFHHPVKGGLACFIYPVGIVKISRPVQAQADEEVVLMEEFAPFVVKKGAIGLHGVQNAHIRTTVFLL